MSQPEILFAKKNWWLEPESNWRHKDFQSSALPTELSSHRSALRRVDDYAQYAVTVKRGLASRLALPLNARRVSRASQFRQLLASPRTEFLMEADMTEQSLALLRCHRRRQLSSCPRRLKRRQSS
tara:strand:- start:32 stop:406 length:375 start_codon:yes stop_codon:yes gene_type:complete